ncbi:MAG: Spy/CpxP family protein refolding chaperone [Vibrio sp.]
MKMKKTLIALIALPMMLGSATAMAKGDGHGEHRGHRGEQGIFKQLDLSDAQKEQIKEIHKQNREAKKADRDANRKAHAGEKKAQMDKLNSLIMAEKFDEDAVRDLIQNMESKRLEGKVQFAKEQHDILQVLTPEQRTKLQELRKEKREARMEKMKERVDQWEAKKSAE